MLTFEHGAAHLAPLSIAIPILGAPVILLIGRRAPRLVVDLVSFVFSVATLGLTAALFAAAASGRVVTWTGGWVPHHGETVGIVLVVDPVGAGLALASAALALVSFVSSLGVVESVHGHYHSLVLLFVGGMVGLALSGDVFDMFGFFELMGAAAYGLTGMMVQEESSLQGALNFGIVNSLGAYATLMGIGLLFARTGRLDLPGLGQQLAHHRPDALVICAFCLVVTGFLVKGALAPFHFWLADAHAVAPASVCILFSGTMVPLGIYATFRIYWVVFGATIPPEEVRRAFLVLGTLTAVVGAVMALSQRHVKRLLSYVTIAHVGLFVTSMSSMTAAGASGAVLYAAGYAGAVGALFLVTGALFGLFGSMDEHQLYAKARGHRLLGLSFLAGALGVASLPPFGTALGNAVAAHALGALGYAWVPALFVGVPALCGGAVLRVGARAFLGLGPRPAEERGLDAEVHRSTGAVEDPQASLERVPLSFGLPIAVLVGGSLATGLLPGVRSAALRAGALFVDRAGYVAQALYRAHVHVAAPHVSNWTGYAVWSGILSVTVAASIAGLALFGRRALGAVPALRQLTRPVRVLHMLHSGHVGDYVAWLMVGIAVLAGFIGLPLH